MRGICPVTARRAAAQPLQSASTPWTSAERAAAAERRSVARFSDYAVLHENCLLRSTAAAEASVGVSRVPIKVDSWRDGTRTTGFTVAAVFTRSSALL